MPWEKSFDQQAALLAAMEAFRAKGYASTSMQDLLEAMGIERGSFYDTFGSKREVYRRALELYQALNAQRLAELEKQYGPREAILKVFEGALRDSFGQGAANQCCLALMTVVEQGPYDQALGAQALQALQGLEAFFYRNLRAAQQQGSVPPELSARKTARSLVVMLSGLRVIGRLPKGREYGRALLAEVRSRLEQP